MSYNIVYQNVNIVCTNMTCGVPQKIGCEPEPRLEITNKNSNPTPILTNRDCKISNCFECKLPKSLFAGLLGLLAGIALGAIAVALVVATGGLAGVVFATAAVAGSVATASLCIGAAALVVGSVVYGYQSAHDCDAVLGMTWDVSHQNILIHKKPVIVDQSLLECPKGGVITIIMDPAIAQQAATMISTNNNKAVCLKFTNQLVQGIINGFTGGANPVSLTINIGCYYLGGDYTSNHYDMLLKGAAPQGTWLENATETGSDIYDGINLTKDAIHDYSNVTHANTSVVAVQKGLSKWEEIELARQTTLIEAQSANAGVKEIKNINQGLKGASKQVDRLAADATKAAQNARNAKLRMVSGIALGVIGGALSKRVGKLFDEEKKGIERDMIKNLNDLRAQDKSKSIVSSNLS